MKKTNLFKTLALFLLMPTLIITGCEKEHTHDYGTLVEKVDATCTTMGHEAYYHCEECDKYFDASKQETTLESLQIGMKDHVWQTVAGQSATCDQEGHTEKIYCTLCGQVREESHVINPTGHAYGQWTITTSPTLVATGVAQRVCGNDNSHVDTYTLPALTDNTFWTKTTFNPTCTTDGRDSYFNSTYGTVEVKIDKLNHNFGEWSIVVNPTNDQTGKAQRVCANDNGHVDEKVLQPLSDAIWVKTTTPSTCIVHGKDTYTSEYGVVEVELPLIGHNYQWEVDEPATKLATGLKHEECTMCHDKKNEGTVIPVADCDHENVTHTDAVAETCETAGSKEYYYCDDCHKYYTDAACQLQVTFGEGESIDTWKVIPAKNHNYGAWVITKPTTEAEGSAVKTCANDANHVVTVTLPVINDENYTIVTQDATCTATGLTTYTLKSDTSISFSEVIEKKEHSYTVKEETEQYLKSVADCEHAAVYYQHCSCGAIDAGHTYTAGKALGHIYTYEVNGDTVTQACSREGCTLSQNSTVQTPVAADTAARALTKGAFSTEKVYVKGIVKSSSVNKDNRYTLYLVSALGDTTSFKILNAEIYGDLKVYEGCEVIAYGYLNNSNNTDYRMAAKGGQPQIVISNLLSYAISSTHTNGIECTINNLPATSQVGTEISFTVTITDSTNYKVDYVTVNGLVVKADADNNYKFQVGIENVVVVNLIGANEELSVTKFGTVDNPNNIEKAWTIANGLADGGYSAFQGYVTGYVKVASGSSITLVDDLSNAAAKEFVVYSYTCASSVPTPVVGDKITAYGYYCKYKNYDETYKMELAVFNNTIKPEVKSIDAYATLTVGTSEVFFDGETSTVASVTDVTGLDGENHINSHSTMTFKVTLTDSTNYKIASVTYGSETLTATEGVYSVVVLENNHIVVNLAENETYAGTAISVTKKPSDIYPIYTWKDNAYTGDFDFDSVLKVTGKVKYLASDTTWRVYNGESFTISAKQGFIIDSFKVFTGNNANYLTLNGSSIKYNQDYEVNGDSFTLGSTGTTKLTSIVVTYHAISSKYDAINLALSEVTNPFTTNYTNNASNIAVATSSTKQVTVNETPVDYTVNYAWASNQTNVTYADGAFNVTLDNETAKTVKVTLTASLGNKSLSKVFMFTTAAKYDEALNNVSVDFEEEYSTAADVTLDYDCGYNDLTVVWTSSNDTYATISEGKVAITIPTTGEETITLTATIQGTGKSKTYTFKVTATASSKKTYTLTISINLKDKDNAAVFNGSYRTDVEYTVVAKATDNTEMNVVIHHTNIMTSSPNLQWKKSGSNIYNSTDLGTIKSVDITYKDGCTNLLTQYYGTSEHPTSGTSVGNGYFTLTNANGGASYTVTITIVFEK